MVNSLRKGSLNRYLDKGCLDKGCDCCLKAILIHHGLDFGMSKKFLKVPLTEIAHPNSSKPESPLTHLRQAHVPH